MPDRPDEALGADDEEARDEVEEAWEEINDGANASADSRWAYWGKIYWIDAVIDLVLEFISLFKR